MKINDKIKWQLELLPLMKGSIVALALFFFLASFTQVGYLHWVMEKSTPSLAANYVETLTQQENLDPATQMHTLTILLEADVVQRRYRQGAVALMARIWVNYLGFVTGMILSLIGSIFILGKLSEEFSIDGKHGETSLIFKSSSPGIVLTILGVSLMVLTIATRHEITIKDRQLYSFGFQESNQPRTEKKTSEEKPILEETNEGD